MNVKISLEKINNKGISSSFSSCNGIKIEINKKKTGKDIGDED